MFYFPVDSHSSSTTFCGCKHSGILIPSFLFSSHPSSQSSSLPCSSHPVTKSPPSCLCLSLPFLLSLSLSLSRHSSPHPSRLSFSPLLSSLPLTKSPPSCLSLSLPFFLSLSLSLSL